MTRIGAEKQLPINLLSTVSVFVLNIVIGIWFVPYLIKHLGIARYGLIPLATSLTIYAGLVTLSFNSAASRYLAIELKKRNISEANKTFNTTLFGISGLLLLLFPLLLMFSYYMPSIFDVPKAYEHETRLLFTGVMGGFLITTWASNFRLSAFAKNRLDLHRGIEVTRIIPRVCIIVILFSLLSSGLMYVGFAYLIGALFGLGTSVMIWRRLTPELRIAFKSFDQHRLRQLGSMGGWLVIDQVGVLLLLNIDLIFVNKIFGCTAAGEYASVQQWSRLLRLMGHTLAVVLTPIILILYAKGERERIINVSKSAVKFMGVGMALPIGLICGFSFPLLMVWIGPEVTKLAPLMCLLVGHLIISCSALPLFPINVASNKVKIPAVVTLATGLVNIILTLFFTLGLTWGVYGVAAAGAITMTLRNVFFSPWYTSKILGINQRLFLRPMVPGVIWGVIIAGVGLVVNRYYFIGTWGKLIIVCGILSILYMIAVWLIGLNREERLMVLSLLPNWVLAKRQVTNG